MVASMIWQQQARPTVKTQNRDDLSVVKAFVEAGVIRPVIDSTFLLADTPKAIERVAGGHARGTVVVSVVDALRAQDSAAEDATRLPDTAFMFA